MKKNSKVLAFLMSALAVAMTATAVSARDASTDSFLKELACPVPNKAINALDLSDIAVNTTIAPTGGSWTNASGAYSKVVYTGNGDEKYFWQVYQGNHSGDKLGWTVKQTAGGEKYFYRAPSATTQENHSRLAVNTAADGGVGTSQGGAGYMVDGMAYQKQVTQFDFMYETPIDANWFTTSSSAVSLDNVTYLARFFRNKNESYSDFNMDQYLTLYLATNRSNAQNGRYTFVTNNWGQGGNCSGKNFPFEFGKWYTARIVTDIKNDHIYFYYFDEDGNQINSSDTNYYLVNDYDWSSRNSNAHINCVSNKIEFGSSKLAPLGIKNIYTAKEAWEIRSNVDVSVAGDTASAAYVVVNDVYVSNSQTYMDVNNMSGGNTSPVCIVAVYDSNNLLKKYSMQSQTVNNRSKIGYGQSTEYNQTITASVDTSDLPSGTYNVRGFVWSNMTDIVPYMVFDEETLVK